MSEAREPETRTTPAPPQPGTGPEAGGNAPAFPSTPPRDPFHSSLSRFFGVVVRPQSWLNLLYLGLSFPLGLFYFVFLIVCLSVGLSLVIVWVGIFILALTAACWWAFAAFERSLADGLLGTRLVPSPQPWRRAEGTWPRIKAHLGSSATWKDFTFLFVKFPLGLLSFVIVVTLGATAVSLIGAPFYYHFAHGTMSHDLTIGGWTINRLWQAMLALPLGLLLAVLSFHVFNGLAAMWRAVAGGLLPPDTTPRPAAAPQPPVQPAAWPAYPGYPAQPGATTEPGTPPAPGAAPAGPPPYGWPYYPYPLQSTPPPAQQQPGAAQTGAQWPAAQWPGAPWGGAPWMQWPAMFAPPQAPPAAVPGKQDAATPGEQDNVAPSDQHAATPNETATEAASPTPETAVPDAAGSETVTNQQAPSQEDHS
jgi:hypothetical protein